MFVNKGKINTSRFFSMLHHEESPEKLQYNMATLPISRSPSHFALPPPPFLAKFSAPPQFPSILKKLNPPYEGGGTGVRTMMIRFQTIQF